MYACRHRPIQTHTRKHEHTHTHTYMHTHIRMHAHTHSLSLCRCLNHSHASKHGLIYYCLFYTIIINKTTFAELHTHTHTLTHPPTHTPEPFPWKTNCPHCLSTTTITTWTIITMLLKHANSDSAGNGTWDPCPSKCQRTLEQSCSRTHSQVSHLGSLSLGDTVVSRCFEGTLGGKTMTIIQLHCPVFEDVSLVGLCTLYLLVFPGGSYCRRLRSLLLLCWYDVFWALIHTLVCLLSYHDHFQL